ncbi:DUF4225 domain-containing protein [Dryocola sp. BD586]|uniref:DUF4225 domain-containing protein n=1 Tax=Dryocola sp. BD586 TaxID=3133271 RepID=UPI003F5063E9
MDIALLNKGWNRSWSDTMVNLEARKLVETANRLSAFHLHNGLIRIKFVEEIKQVVEHQFAAARRARTDEECMICIRNLRAETENLREQDRLLRTRAAQLYAKVEFIRENNKIVGYVISAVNVALSGLVLFGGFVMLSTMGPTGALAGAVLIIDGINGLTREAMNFEQPPGHIPSQGIVADSVMQTARFMGFSPQNGLAFYNAVTLSANIYSIIGLTRKPEAWRLFKWIPHDYYRKVNTMSRPKLTMKIAGQGVKAKVIFDLLTMDNENS